MVDLTSSDVRGFPAIKENRGLNILNFHICKRVGKFINVGFHHAIPMVITMIPLC